MDDVDEYYLNDSDGSEDSDKSEDQVSGIESYKEEDDSFDSLLREQDRKNRIVAARNDYLDRLYMEGMQNVKDFNNFHCSEEIDLNSSLEMIFTKQ